MMWIIGAILAILVFGIIILYWALIVASDADDKEDDYWKGGG